jgi:hypothetical protein
MFHSLCPMVENLRICNLRICNLRRAHLKNLRICNLLFNQKKFADLKFLYSHISEMCGILIVNWAQEFEDLRFADLKTHLHAHLCNFATIFNHTGGKNLPPVSTNLQNFEKIQNGPNGILRGLGETNSWKTWNWKSRGNVPLNFLLHIQNITAKLKAADSHCQSCQIKSYIPWLWIYLKVPPPHSHTQKGKQNCVSDVSKF